MFTTQQQEPATMFDVPHFIVEALKSAAERSSFTKWDPLID